MSPLRKLHVPVALALAAIVAVPPAQALITFNESHDHIYVTGTVSVASDSNIFSSADGEGDYIVSSSVSAEYTRRAGWIGVNFNAGVAASNYGKFRSEDFMNPSLSMELTKKGGRTPLSFTLSANRASRADSAVNVRTTSWNYNAGLNFRYHIVGTWDLSGGLGYSSRVYTDETVFANLATYSGNIDLYHVLSTERDMVMGYRYRYSETSRDTHSTDHGINGGLNGKIIRGVTGSMRLGYQQRTSGGVGVTGDNKYDSWTASGSTSYAFNKKSNVGLSISKDFSTTADDTSVDTLSAGAEFQYAFTSRFSSNASASWMHSQFLGEGGRVELDPGPPVVLGRNREDTSVALGWGLNWARTEHLRLSFSYTWSKNWSTLSFADFVRSSYSLTLSSRW